MNGDATSFRHAVRPLGISGVSEGVNVWQHPLLYTAWSYA
jgi:hypothetical protein